jgi:hypothetical protein
MFLNKIISYGKKIISVFYQLFSLSGLIFILLFIYIGQSSIFSLGSFIGSVCLFSYLLLSTFLIWKGLLRGYTSFSLYRSILIFLLLNTVYFILNPNGINEFYLSQFRTIYFTITTFFVFFYISYNKKITSDLFVLGCIALGTISIFNYFTYAVQENLTELLQNNAIYYLLWLLPSLFYFKNRLLSVGILVFSLLFIISSLKRGAIITASIFTVLYFIYQAFTLHKSLPKIKRFFLISVYFIFFISLCIFLGNEFIKNENLVNRFLSISEDGGSSRDYIFKEIVYKSIDSGSFLNIIFGYGFVGSTNFAFSGTAHNDLLEAFSNFGIIGFSILIFIWFRILRISQLHNSDKKTRYVLFTIGLMWIIDSQYQQVYNSDQGYAMMMVLGFTFGRISLFNV